MLFHIYDTLQNRPVGEIRLPVSHGLSALLLLDALPQVTEVGLSSLQ